MSLPDYHIVAKLDAASGLLITVAGNGAAGYTGDGGLATSAQLSYPTGLALDPAGSLYIADLFNSVVRKVSGGVITTVAGNGTLGFSGDNGPATIAQLNSPDGIAVDAGFNLYIADSQNQRIRKVSGGVIATVAGDGAVGPAADGPATSAHLMLPAGAAVDSAGNLYIADSYNHCIREVSGGLITTVAGTGLPGSLGDGGPATSASLSVPTGVFVDASGNLYIADYLSDRVRKVTQGVITTVAGNGVAGFSGDGGQATAAELNHPYSVAADGSGNIYVADWGNMRVRKIAAGVITTAAGIGGGGFSGDGGAATSAQLSNPSGVALDTSGSLYIADTNNHAVRKISGGTIMTVAGDGTAGFSGDGGPAAGSRLNHPMGVAVDAGGNLYIADSGNNVVRKVSGGVITTVAGNGTAGTTGDGGPATSAQLESPNAVAVDSAGALYIAVHYQYEEPGLFGAAGPITVTASQVRKVFNATISTVASVVSSGYSGGIGYIGGMAFDSAGTLFYSDQATSQVYSISNGTTAAVAGTGKTGFGGDNGAGTSAQLSNPNGVWVDGSGALWIADTGNQRVRKVDNGAITTVAGTGPPALQGMPQFGGDGGPAAAALLNTPIGLVVDASGRAYIADSGNNRIRVLIPSDSCAGVVTWSALQIGAAGGNLTANIVTSDACAWSFAGLPSWITIAPASSGTGPATVTLIVAANGGLARTATVAAAGQDFTISQAVAMYTLSGRVTAGGQPLAGVFVSISSGTTPALFALTGTNGNYSLSFPAILSLYNIGASYAGYNFLTQCYGVLPFGDQTCDFTGWILPNVTGISAGFVSAKQPAPAGYAPGEIISLYGTNLCAGQQSAAAPLPVNLAGCAVWLNGTQLPLYFGSAGQINAVLPQLASAGTASLNVWRYTDTSDTELAAQTGSFAHIPVQIVPVSMAFVEIADNGQTILAVQYTDGGFAGSARPVTPGDIVTLYMTGLGQTTPLFPDGVAPNTTADALAPVQVSVEDVSAKVLYAGAQPQYPGLDEIVLQLPQYTVPSVKQTATFAITAPSVSQTVAYEVPSR